MAGAPASSCPHRQSIPDAKGFSYMLPKANVGQYPWELIDK